MLVGAHPLSEGGNFGLLGKEVDEGISAVAFTGRWSDFKVGLPDRNGCPLALVPFEKSRKSSCELRWPVRALVCVGWLGEGVSKVCGAYKSFEVMSWRNWSMECWECFPGV